MATPKPMLPDCGLYLTTQAPPGQRAEGARRHDRLLPQPLRQRPAAGHHARPQHPQPLALPRPRDRVSRPELGELAARSSRPKVSYTLRRELKFDGGTWPKGAIVQLGYTGQGDPILFIARVRSRLDENDLFFSDKGLKLKREELNVLEPAPIYQEPDDGSSGHAPSHTH